MRTPLKTSLALACAALLLTPAALTLSGCAQPGCDPDANPEQSCGTSESDTHHHETDSETHHHETDSETHHHETETETTDSSSSGSTGTDTESGTDTHGTGTIDGITPQDYCDCMLAYCHDEYHDTWGEHPESEPLCLADAESWPVAGMSVEEGDFLECRIHQCLTAMATGDPLACGIALNGGAPCE